MNKNNIMEYQENIIMDIVFSEEKKVKVSIWYIGAKILIENNYIW